MYILYCLGRNKEKLYYCSHRYECFQRQFKSHATQVTRLQCIKIIRDFNIKHRTLEQSHRLNLTFGEIKVIKI